MATTPCPDCGAALGPFFDLNLLPTSCPECGWKQGKKKPAKAGRYNARKVEEDGIIFDSKSEWTRYRHLKLLRAAGQLWNLEIHPQFDLGVCKYTADFAYDSLEGHVVEDVKSVATRRERDWPLRKKLMLERHGIAVREVIV